MHISALASSFKYNWLDLMDNALQQSHPCGRCQNTGCSQSRYNQSASSIFGKDVEHDVLKEIKESCVCEGCRRSVGRSIWEGGG